MKGSIEIDAFSIDGNWGYAYKKGLFRWTDSGTFRLAFKKLRVNIIMSITIEGPDKHLKSVGGEERGACRPRRYRCCYYYCCYRCCCCTWRLFLIGFGCLKWLFLMCCWCRFFLTVIFVLLIIFVSFTFLLIVFK